MVNQIKSLTSAEFFQTVGMRPYYIYGVTSSGSFVSFNGDRYFINDVFNTTTGSLQAVSFIQPVSITGSSITASKPVGITGSVLANQNAAGTVANSWPVKITDGVNTVATANLSGTVTQGLVVYLGDAGGIVGLAPGTIAGAGVNDNSASNLLLGTNMNTLPTLGGSELGVVSVCRSTGSSPSWTNGAWSVLTTDLSGNLFVTGSFKTYPQIAPSILTSGSVGITGSGGAPFENLVRPIGFRIAGSNKSLITTGSVISAAGTTIITQSPAWVSSILVSADVSGTTAALFISGSQTGSVGQGILLNGLAGTATTTPTTISFTSPIQMDSIFISQTAVAAAKFAYWVSYWQ